MLYFAGIGIYTRVSSDPIIFFSSLLIGLFAAVASGLLIKFIWKRIDSFTVFLMATIYYLGIIIMAVFGPTFIDRSISYHIAFIAVEENGVDVSRIEDIFSEDIFEKRIHDASVTGFVTIDEDGCLLPTAKSRFVYMIMMPIGKLTGSLGTYNDMKESLYEE